MIRKRGSFYPSSSWSVPPRSQVSIDPSPYIFTLGILSFHHCRRLTSTDQTNLVLLPPTFRVKFTYRPPLHVSKSAGSLTGKRRLLLSTLVGKSGTFPELKAVPDL